MLCVYFVLSELFHKLILLNINPEISHNIATKFLASGFVSIKNPYENKILSTECLDQTFKNPIGLAAGFDKNAECLSSLKRLGFGFLEVGTATKFPQEGNKKPRLFRLKEDYAIINRMGFNNKGINNLLENIKKNKINIPLGINIGKNRDSADSIADYVDLFTVVHSLCNYVVLNISSPNTVGLRDMQKNETLSSLLEAVLNKKNELQSKTKVVLKVSPDIDEKEINNIASVSLAKGIDALIVSNTTVTNRENLKSIYRNEQGGLSGAPLNDLNLKLTEDFYNATHGNIPIISCGGITNAQDVLNRIKKGATIIQLYSAIIYHGFKVVEDIKKELAQMLQAEGVKNIKEIVGCECKKRSF
ncbi:quinone-dependent dihydroorotate dehydrogenase [Anaplasmataceae bacterium AB001_6]|nr:quinone-dependent dihydroorotate dehydrogenase [Anaplasmataceae bacterium AB001_6]